MPVVGRKHESIDVLKLYAEGDAKKWNAFLTRCLVKKDTKKLVATLYGLQAGMKDIADKGISSEKLAIFFIRLECSIEKTIQNIDRGSLVVPYDVKKKKDHALEATLHRVRF